LSEIIKKQRGGDSRSLFMLFILILFISSTANLVAYKIIIPVTSVCKKFLVLQKLN